MSLKFSTFLLRIICILSVTAFLASCGGGGSSSGIDTEDEIDNSSQFKLVWSDEFNGDSLDDSKWNIETGYGPNNSGWGNDESQLYTESPDNLTVENDNLVITARCDTGICGKRDGSITSAKINTKSKLELQFGKVEARIKLPNGRSTWPAFWMLGANFPGVPWPRSGEIDIMEMHQTFSDINTTHTTVHWFDESRPVNNEWRFFSQQKRFNSPLTEDFHVFTLEWDKNFVVGKIDGEAFFLRDISKMEMSELQQPFYLILNIAIDGTLGGEPSEIKTTPQEMLVDWVRVYENNNGDSFIAGAPSSSTFDGGLIENAGFENGVDEWLGNAANVTNEPLGYEGSRANFANVASSGNPWDVNLGQILDITQGETYQFSFKAKSNGNRTIVAGIGLNEPPYTNDSKLVTLTTEWQTFEFLLSSASFGNNNSRVFFDMGADTGQVIIDEVSLVKIE